MRRLGNLLLLALAINGALLAGRLAAPAITVACSCVAVEPGAPRLVQDEGIVVVGVVGQADGLGNYEFAVERVFNGDVPAAAKLGTGRQVFADGTEAWNSCGRDHTPGQHVILLGGIDNGVINAGSCAPYALVESQEGRAILAEAQAMYGEGRVPGPPIPPAPEPGGLDLASIAIAAVLGLLVVVIVSVVIASLGRGGGAAQSRA